MTYCLIDEPWIPVLGPGGGAAQVGLRDALVRAHDFRELRDSSPLVTAALHRLLLAVLHRAYDGPAESKDWASMWRAGRFDEGRIGAYLERWRGRFDLFDAVHPFYQIGRRFDVASKDGRLPVAQLGQELAGGHNSTLFDHTSDESPAVWEPAVCARRLVANQAFALGLGVSPKTSTFRKRLNRKDAPLVRGVTVILMGDNLFQTLMLNLLLYAETGTFPVRKCASDIPAWERDQPRDPGEHTPEGWLDLLTWQSRCVRLFPEDGGVRRMAYAQGLSVNADSRSRDPMWFYEMHDGNAAKISPIRLDPEKALWRSADSLFAFAADGDSNKQRRPRSFVHARDMNKRGLFGQRNRLRCSIFGIATEPGKAAKPKFWAHDRLPVPTRLLDDEDAVGDLRRGLQIAEKAGFTLCTSFENIARRLGKSEKGEVRDFVKNLGADLRFWAALDLPFREFLDELATDRSKALVAWCDTVRQSAWGAFDSATDGLGGSPRELRARVEAARFLEGRLK